MYNVVTRLCDFVSSGIIATAFKNIIFQGFAVALPRVGRSNCPTAATHHPVDRTAETDAAKYEHAGQELVHTKAVKGKQSIVFMPELPFWQRHIVCTFFSRFLCWGEGGQMPSL